GEVITNERVMCRMAYLVARITRKRGGIVKYSLAYFRRFNTSCS
ncbi:hypothetical protein ACN38_g9521, partial [Penicillium nordicum]